MILSIQVLSKKITGKKKKNFNPKIILNWQIWTF